MKIRRWIPTCTRRMRRPTRVLTMKNPTVELSAGPGCARAVDGSAGYEIDFEKIKTKKRRGTAVFAPPVTLMPTPRHGSYYTYRSE